ncbi:probable disease resistance protein At5g43730 [Arabidopsis lyrata subsp. lyrata]|uniref:probable disease resistance protein At5g43730 n=1 Tax=Arabidopsis lyrata subsp. lyrata TaxID=81972 RepID=UPI000A29ABDB|nr:probable disease resistance protein At5g43730 [Arabidopsis lyrata subsp. lyrata]|eukprot:XP_020871029.1 probable disease resistance protein At5g43730 [Arabidopsis lyrata subsp. lyrata]
MADLLLLIPWNKIFTFACGCFLSDRNYIHLMESNLDALETTMEELKNRRDDLLGRVSVEEDKGLQRLAQVNGWLSRVEIVESQFNDLLEARSTETGRLCLFGYCSEDCISSYNYGEKVSKMLEEVEELLSKKDFVEVAQKIIRKAEKKHIQTTVGLDTLVEMAWESVMNDEIRTLGLYGMGGVGKTTLLACINNKFVELESEFDVVIWVVVSNDFQYEGIQDQILGRLRLDKEWKQETEKEKALCIDNILNRKKFVLLLDDLWSEMDLNKIGVPPPTRANGSKIVFTTRSKEVCKDMKADKQIEVDCLSPDKAWELFRITVGDVIFSGHQDIPALARRVAAKCHGLPLALNVIGKAMACKETLQEWYLAINVLNSLGHEFPGMKERILGVLKFSYDSLKNGEIKSCFLYCSLFPEDFEIKKEQLIEYWICEGFINPNRYEDGGTYQGYDIIGLLVRAHLLIDCGVGVKMHDVIREMALWINSDYGNQQGTICVKSGAHVRLIPNDINWEIVRQMSLISNQIEKISCSPNCPNLSTLLLPYNELVDISVGFFRFIPKLVVLDHVHEISLVGIATTLPNLQVLKLFFSRVCVDDILMEELQQLEHLKILTANIEDATILERIQGIDRLASCIRGLCLLGMSAPRVILSTIALGGLQRLAIESCNISEIKIDWESKERRELSPMEIHPGFKQLSTVNIFRLKGQRDLSWLLFAQNLKELDVRDSPEIEEIINKEKGMSITKVHPDIVLPFGNLESLELYNLDELKEICWNFRTLPNLRNFKVKNCPKSKSRFSQAYRVIRVEG